MTDQRVLFFVGFLVVLAGCGALPGGLASETSTPTLTPVPVTEPPDTPTETETSTRVDLPPGVGGDGAVNLTRLVAAHEAFVADRSYAWQYRHRLSSDATDAYQLNATRQVRVSDARYFVEERNSGYVLNRSLYVDGGVGHLRSERDAENESVVVSNPGDHRSYASAGDVLSRYLGDQAVDLAVVDRNGQTYYRLHSTEVPGGFTDREAVKNIWNYVRNYTVTAYVTPDGFVQTLVVSYELVDSGNREASVFVRYDYTDVGSATVERPVWVTTTPTPTANPPSTERSPAVLPAVSL